LIVSDHGPDFKNLAASLRHARLNKGYTQEELAEILGFSARFLQRIESGAHSNLTLVLLGKFANALETDSWKFLCAGSIPVPAQNRRARKQTIR
jgi:transcriptional regulator with XRE-family HTH domain